MNVADHIKPKNELACRMCGPTQWMCFIGDALGKRPLIIFVCQDCKAVRYLDLATAVPPQ